MGPLCGHCGWSRTETRLLGVGELAMGGWARGLSGAWGNPKPLKRAISIWQTNCYFKQIYEAVRYRVRYSGWGQWEWDENEARRIRMLLGVGKHLLNTCCVPYLVPGTTVKHALSQWQEPAAALFCPNPSPRVFLDTLLSFSHRSSRLSCQGQVSYLASSPSSPLPLSSSAAGRASGLWPSLPPVSPLTPPAGSCRGRGDDGFLKHSKSGCLPQLKRFSGLSIAFKVKSKFRSGTRRPLIAGSCLAILPSPGFWPPSHLESQYMVMQRCLKYLQGATFFLVFLVMIISSVLPLFSDLFLKNSFRDPFLPEALSGPQVSPGMKTCLCGHLRAFRSMSSLALSSLCVSFMRAGAATFLPTQHPPDTQTILRKYSSNENRWIYKNLGPILQMKETEAQRVL